MLWKRFKVESGDCSSDYLEMYDTSLYNINSSSNLIGRFCGRSYPNITSYPTQRYLTFKWHTDGSKEDKGFKVLAVRNLPCESYKQGLPRSGKKFWKMKNFPGQGKVRGLHFSQGNLKKNEKSHGKVREFQNFPKKMLVNRLLETLVAIICK